MRYWILRFQWWYCISYCLSIVSIYYIPVLLASNNLINCPIYSALGIFWAQLQKKYHKCLLSSITSYVYQISSNYRFAQFQNVKFDQNLQYITTMTEPKAKMDCQEVMESLNNEYLLQFMQISGINEDQKQSADHLYLFYCYILSRKIQQIVLKIKHSPENGNNLKFGQLNRKVNATAQIKEIKNQLRQLHESSKVKRSKDRKTSFFRTIVKHLKKKQKIKKNKIPSNNILNQLQEKLSKNTVSRQDIKALMASDYQSAILEYMTSQQIYSDLILKNKSKTNKGFYILHLREIVLYLKNKKFEDFEFFTRASLYQQIEGICKTYYKEYWGSSPSNQSQKIVQTRQGKQLFDEDEGLSLYFNFSRDGQFDPNNIESFIGNAEQLCEHQRGQNSPNNEQIDINFHQNI